MEKHMYKRRKLCLSTKTTSLSVFIIVVFSLSIEIVHSQEFMPLFLAEPRNLTASNGTTNITFHCAIGYNNTAPPQILWFKGLISIFLNNDSLSTEPQPNRKVIHMSTDSLTNLERNFSQKFKNLIGLTLIISPLQISDDDEYKCQVIPGNVIKSAKLTVFVPPEKPTMTFMPGLSEWQDGQTVKFTCNSSMANPFSSVFIKWLLNDDELIQSSQSNINITSTPQLTKFGGFASDMSLTLTRNLFGKVVKCIVNYKDLSGSDVSKMAEDQQLKFKYGPYINITITSSSASITIPSGSSSSSASSSSSSMSLNSSIIKVLENTTLMMRCNSDSYPPSNATDQTTWTYNETTVAGSMLPITKIPKNPKNATYICLADNGYKKSQASVTFDVLYAPKLIMPAGIENNTIRIMEGMSFNFSFVVDANPFPNSQDFVWYRGESRFGSGEVLQISSITRNYSSVYSLYVTSKLEPFDSNSTVLYDQNSIMVVVNYPPGKASLTASKKAVYQGGELMLNCSLKELDPDLETTVMWELNSVEINPSSQFVVSLRTLNLVNVTSSAGGNYTCRARNKAGLGTASESLEIQIIEIPKILSFTPSGSSIELSIGDELPVMTCEVSGKSKQPKLSWTKNGKQTDDVMFNITNQALPTLGSDTGYVVTSILRMRSGSVDASTSGNYSCLATTVIGDEFVLGSINILVKYPPVFTDKPSNQTYDINGTAYLSCKYSGYPAPSISWMKNGIKINTGIETADQGKYQIKSFIVSAFIQEVQLVIGSLLENDGGKYDCIVNNSLGIANQSLFLTVRTRPKTISSMLFKETWESIQLSWSAGQDGGYVQAFRVFVKTSSNGQISNSPFTTNSNYINLTGLMPNTSYLVSIEAFNQLGSSGMSKDLEVKTSVLSMPSTRGINYVARSTTIYSLNVPSQPEYLCLLVRPVSRPNTGNWTCTPVSPGQTDFNINLGSNLQHPWEAAFCLLKRQEICGVFSSLDIDTQPIGVQGIIAMAVLLPLLLIALLVVLAISIYCCRKKYSKRTDDKKMHSSNQTDIPSNNEYSLKTQSDSSGSIGSEKVDIDNDISEHSKHPSSSDESKGYINQTFYYDTPMSEDLFTLDAVDGENFVTKKKVFHEIVV